MLQTRKLETPPSPHALSPSRPIVPRPIKTQRKPPSHSSARRGSAAAAHPARSDARHSLTLNRRGAAPANGPSRARWRSAGDWSRSRRAGEEKGGRRRKAESAVAGTREEARQAPGNTLVKFSDQDNGGADGAVLQCKFRSSFNSSSGLLLFSLLLLIPDLKHFVSRWGTQMKLLLVRLIRLKLKKLKLERQRLEW